MSTDADNTDKRVAKLESELARLKQSARAPARKPIRKRSPRVIFGLPLYDIAIGPDFDSGELRGRARGIFAVGDFATGIVAFGGIAQGVFAFGGVAIGLFAAGGAAVGLLAAAGGAAIGGVAVGGAVIGYIALGGAALSMGKMF